MALTCAVVPVAGRELTDAHATVRRRGAEALGQAATLLGKVSREEASNGWNGHAEPSERSQPQPQPHPTYRGSMMSEVRD